MSSQLGAIKRRPPGVAIPLSFNQRQLWFLHRTLPGTAAYNIPTFVRLRGSLDMKALTRALNEVTRRHEILRTRFVGSEGQPLQIVEVSVLLPLDQEDLQNICSEEREEVLRKRLEIEGRRGFDLEQLPLLRVRLFHLAPDDHVLAVVVHHIIGDGWSISVLFNELNILYEAFRIGESSPLPELPLQYADYALWQHERLRQGGFAADLAYWRTRLANAPQVLELPTDHLRPDKPKFIGTTEYITLDAALVEALRALNRRAGTTLYMTILAAYGLLLHRYTGQEQILIGTPTANRERGGLQGLIGFFVNMLVMRLDLSGNPSFIDLLKRVRNGALEAYERPDLPFELLVEELQPERTLNRNPLFQVVFSFSASSEPSSGKDSTTWPPFSEFSNSTCKFDLGAIVAQDSSGVRINLGFNSELFRTATCERFKQHFSALLNAVAANPEAPVATISILLPTERGIAGKWRDTRTAYTRERLVHEIFQSRTERTPEARALIYPSGTLTYRELDEAANRTARYLQELGVGSETVVGLYMERSWQLVVSMLAVLKAGGTYLPLDLDQPAERLQFMLEDAGAAVVITQNGSKQDLPADISRSCRQVSYENIPSAVNGPMYLHGTPDSLAYIIYTSGSTGQPKGIGVPHRAVARLVCETNYIKLGSEDRIAQASNSSFDAATFEIWGALLNGGSIVGMSKEEALSPTLAGLRIRDDKITTMFLTTALFNQFAATGETDVFRELKYLLFGGEAVDPRWVRAVLNGGAPQNLLHVYGPTENTTFSTWHNVRYTEADRTVPIGLPVSNTEAYVLDRHLTPVATGVVGELYVGGEGLARGYVNRPDLTAACFVPNPFAHQPGERLYRTGDFVKYRSDGAIEFVGRIDDQLKLRGFRIEPGEIEAAIRSHAGVQESIVLSEEDQNGDKRLIGFVVATPETDKQELRRHLKQRLPDYMVPAQLVLVNEFPLTANGKVDRRKLLDYAPDSLGGEFQTEHVAPRNELEQTMANIWGDMLGVKDIGIYDNVFDLGGHSLLLMQIYARMQRQLSETSRIKLTDLFIHPTINALAQLMGAEEAVNTAS